MDNLHKLELHLTIFVFGQVLILFGLLLLFWSGLSEFLGLNVHLRFILSVLLIFSGIVISFFDKDMVDADLEESKKESEVGLASDEKLGRQGKKEDL